MNRRILALVLAVVMMLTLAACKKNGKFCWTLGMTAEETRKKLDMGFDGILTFDTAFLISGAKEYLKSVKE